MRIGKSLEVELKCAICSSEIKEIEYAIRDSHSQETYFSWMFRHLKSALTLGLARPDPKVFLPVCYDCVEKANKKYL